MYSQLAKPATIKVIQLLFSQLANLRWDHKARQKDIYTPMAFPDVW